GHVDLPGRQDAADGAAGGKDPRPAAADAAGAPHPETGRPGQVEQGDCRGDGDRAEDGRRAPDEHLQQARYPRQPRPRPLRCPASPRDLNVASPPRRAPRGETIRVKWVIAPIPPPLLPPDNRPFES